MTLSGLPNAQLQWRASINRYYKGGLEEFSDAQTVRIQLRYCHQFLEQMAKLEEGIDDGPNMDDWNKAFGEEKVAVGALIGELQGWLKARGLEL